MRRCFDSGRSDGRTTLTRSCPSNLGRAVRAGLAAAVLLLAACSRDPAPSFSVDSTVEKLRALTGAHTRVVWVQDAQNHGDFSGSGGRPTLLFGFDTASTGGERLILPKARGYTKPLITPRGDRVVFTEYRRGIPRLGRWQPGDKVMFSRTRRIETRIVNWDGTDLRTIAPGFALDVWIDPGSGREWVFVQAGPHRGRNLKNNAVYRYPLDERGDAELVWDQTAVDGMGAGSFQVSADGRRAAGLFPWPEAGVINLSDGSWDRIGGGCWTGLAPDNSYRTWIFDGAHRHLLIGAPDGRVESKVSVTTAKTLRGAEAYHPRWSNLPRFLTVTGPYHASVEKGMRGNPSVEVLVGRLDKGFSAVEAWVKLTSNKRGDYFPDLWIERGPDAPAFPPHSEMETSRVVETITWPSNVGGLEFLWENAAGKNEVVGHAHPGKRRCRVEPHGFAHVGRYNVMQLAGRGGFRSAGDGGELLAALRASGDITIELTLVADERTPRAVPVFNIGKAESPHVTLTQDGENLHFSLVALRHGKKQAHELDLGPIGMRKPVHVVAAYSTYGSLTVYVNGREVNRLRDKPTTFANWVDASLTFGDQNGNGSSPAWKGTIDGVAIYSLCLNDERAAHHAELNLKRLSDRSPAAASTILATLREVTPVPPAQAIAPYTRCLVVYRYEVRSVEEGPPVGNQILVAHWGLLDGQPVINHAPASGTTFRLTVESMDDHPHLLSERMDISTEELHLPMYYDPTPRDGEWLTSNLETHVQP